MEDGCDKDKDKSHLVKCQIEEQKLWGVWTKWYPKNIQRIYKKYPQNIQWKFKAYPKKWNEEKSSNFLRWKHCSALYAPSDCGDSELCILLLHEIWWWVCFRHLLHHHDVNDDHHHRQHNHFHHHPLFVSWHFQGELTETSPKLLNSKHWTRHKSSLSSINHRHRNGIGHWSSSLEQPEHSIKDSSAVNPP